MLFDAASYLENSFSGSELRYSRSSSLGGRVDLESDDSVFCRRIGRVFDNALEVFGVVDSRPDGKTSISTLWTCANRVAAAVATAGSCFAKRG